MHIAQSLAQLFEPGMNLLAQPMDPWTQLMVAQAMTICVFLESIQGSTVFLAQTVAQCIAKMGKNLVTPKWTKMGVLGLIFACP